MEASPLTRLPQPEVFTPKIIQLYESLFKLEDDEDEEDEVKPEGFWQEFFLLRPDRAALQRMLSDMAPTDVLQLESETRQLFSRAIVAMKSDRGNARPNALDTLSIFLSCVLAKKYPHPSSDIIAILAGLDHIDPVLTDFVGTLDSIIRNGSSLDVRHKAVKVLLGTTAGAYQTTLLTYMLQRDLFPSIMKFVQDTEKPGSILEPFALIGLLANYNKFEFQNPYQMRLSDFVNEATIGKIIECVGYACQAVRADYIDVQEDLPEGWTLSRTLNLIGLGFFAPGPKPEKKPVYDDETAKQMFAKLPGPNASLLLATYDFAHANKMFCISFVSSPANKPAPAAGSAAAAAGTAGPGEEPPIASYLSLTSYFLQHAHLSSRATAYAHLNLMVFRLLIEDASICKRMCSEESKAAVRLCRHRQPFLPLVRGERVLATAVLDCMVDGVNHNLRRRLDVGLYTLCVGTLLRVVSYLSRTRTRLRYHWSELFRSLLSLVRFLMQYTADLEGLTHMGTLLDLVVNLIALSLSAGEAFLPTPAAYDDLFYKVVESGDVLARFKDNYRLGQRPSNSIDTILSVCSHYRQMLSDNGGKRLPANLTAAQVADLIKQGYDSLSIQTREGLDTWERFREADERTVLKKMARAAVADARTMVEQ